MSNGFLGAFKEGQRIREGSGTAIGALLGEIEKSRDRRRKESTKVADEERALADILTKIDAETEATKDIEKFKVGLEKDDPVALLIRKGKALDAARSLGDEDTVRSILGKTPVAGITAQETRQQVVDQGERTQGILQQTGIQPSQAQGLLQQTGIQPTQQDSIIGEIDIMTGKESARSQEARKDLAAEREIQKQVGAQEEKFREEQTRNFRIAKDALKLTLRKFTKMAETTKRITGLKAGRLGGVATVFLGATGANPDVAPFRGQLSETSARIAKIAAPSARVGIKLIEVFKKTLPSNFSNMPEAKGQILTSITNAFINFANTNPDDFPEGVNFDVFESEMSKVLDQVIEEGRSIGFFDSAEDFSKMSIEQLRKEAGL